MAENISLTQSVITQFKADIEDDYYIASEGEKAGTALSQNLEQGGREALRALVAQAVQSGGIYSPSAIEKWKTMAARTPEVLTDIAKIEERQKTAIAFYSQLTSEIQDGGKLDEKEWSDLVRSASQEGLSLFIREIFDRPVKVTMPDAYGEKLEITCSIDEKTKRAIRGFLKEKRMTEGEPELVVMLGKVPSFDAQLMRIEELETTLHTLKREIALLAETPSEDGEIYVMALDQLSASNVAALFGVLETHYHQLKVRDKDKKLFEAVAMRDELFSYYPRLVASLRGIVPKILKDAQGKPAGDGPQLDEAIRGFRQVRSLLEAILSNVENIETDLVVYEQGRRDKKTLEEVQIRITGLLVRRGKIKGALRDLRQFIARGWHSASHLLKLGEIYHLQGEYPRSITTYNQVLEGLAGREAKERPEELVTETLFAKGRALEALADKINNRGMLEEALKVYKEAKGSPAGNRFPQIESAISSVEQKLRLPSPLPPKPTTSESGVQKPAGAGQRTNLHLGLSAGGVLNNINNVDGFLDPRFVLEPKLALLFTLGGYAEIRDGKVTPTDRLGKLHYKRSTLGVELAARLAIGDRVGVSLFGRLRGHLAFRDSNWFTGIGCYAGVGGELKSSGTPKHPDLVPGAQFNAGCSLDVWKNLSVGPDFTVYLKPVGFPKLDLGGYPISVGLLVGLPF